MTRDLFDPDPGPPPAVESFAPGAWRLRGFALGDAAGIVADLGAITVQAGWRRPVTPGGRPFSVEMTNCGPKGWVSDVRGYRYVPVDPLGGRPWAPLPPAWTRLAQGAAAAVGYDGFTPDACLINRYAPGASMGLHQDRDERDFTQPIVSVSLGLPATFLFGGATRGDRAQRITLDHGDVVVWGGPSRLFFHGIAKLPDGQHPLTGRCRINLTFRRTD
jgi:alkylated DNA repair protein (DNA oxidative demethylase)